MSWVENRDDYELVTAHFSNDQKTDVKCFFREKATGEINPYYVQANDNKQYNTLLEMIDIDQIHKNTWAMVDESQNQIRDLVFRIGKEKGWLFDIAQDAEDEAKIASTFFKILFRENETSKDNERLFFLKMELFELEWVKTCKDRELKKALRKSKTYIDTMQAAINIWNATRSPSSEDETD